jgi:hypothetical protein
MVDGLGTEVYGYVLMSYYYHRPIRARRCTDSDKNIDKKVCGILSDI